MLGRSPLDAQHRALQAKMGAFGGWDMPISYGGTVAEHTSVRERVGLFDVSHLGKVRVSGPDAAAFLDTQLSNRMQNLAPGRARYTLLLNGDAGIVDDLIVYGIGVDDYLVVPNASNRDAVVDILRAAAPDTVGLEVLEWTTLAVQGPRAPEIVEALYPAAKAMGYMHVVQDGSVVIARSGYTGERGYEVFTTAEDAVPTWDRLLGAVRDAGGEPCGLAARDTLRLEMGYPLHGNDIDPATRPDEAGLMWAVKLDGRDFPGADALRGGSPSKRLIALRARDRAIPRRGHPVVRDGDAIGECTSGTFSPTLKTGIALASVRVDVSVGETVSVDVRGKLAEFEVVSLPFVERSPK